MKELFLVHSLALSKFRSHDAFIGLNSRLVERINISQLPLISDGHRKHVEQLAEMIRRELWQRKAGVVALVGSQCICIGLTSHFQRLSHRYTRDISQLGCLWEYIRDLKVVLPVLETDELNVDVAYIKNRRIGKTIVRKKVKESAEAQENSYVERK